MRQGGRRRGRWLVRQGAWFVRRRPELRKRGCCIRGQWFGTCSSLQNLDALNLFGKLLFQDQQVLCKFLKEFLLSARLDLQSLDALFQCALRVSQTRWRPPIARL